ncbi:hypothetical protein [Arthrobacter sp. UYCu723]
MSAIHVENSVTINHKKLGAEVWEWDADQQADFLAGFAKAFRGAEGTGIFQISYIADELHREPSNLEAVRWLNDRLTEYLAEPV